MKIYLLYLGESMNNINRYKIMMKNSNLFKLCIGSLASALGTNIQSITLGLYIYSVTKSTAQLGIILSLAIIPKIILYPIGGVVSDNRSKKNMMAYTDIINFICVFLAYILFINDIYAIPVLYVLVVIQSVISAFFLPAAKSIIPEIVEEKEIGLSNSILNFFLTMSQFLAPLIGVALLKYLGMGNIILLNALSFLGSGILEYFIKSNYVKQITPASNKLDFNKIYMELIDGFKYMLNNRNILNIALIAAVINFVLGPFLNMGYMIISEDILNVGSVGYGALQTSYVIGSLLGTFIYSLIGEKIILKKVLITGMHILNTLIALFLIVIMNPVDIGFVIGILLSLGIGIIEAVIDVAIFTMIHISVDKEYMARTMSVVGTVALCSIPIGQILFGIITEHIFIGYVIPALVLLLFIMLLINRNIQIGEE